MLSLVTYVINNPRCWIDFNYISTIDSINTRAFEQIIDEKA